MGLYGLGVLVVMDDLEQMIPQTEALQSPHLPVELLGNLLVVEFLRHIQQQSKLMGLYGLGVLMVLDNLVTLVQHREMFRSPHLPEEPLGNKFLLEKIIQQQSKLMGLYGLGVLVLQDNLVIFPQQTEVLQSPHLPVEQIGSLLFVEVVIRQQSKLMVVFGLGVVMKKGNLEQMIPQTEALQSPHL